MFEQYVIVDGSLRSTPDGWAVDLRIPYYRGLGLSMVNLQLELDGHIVRQEDVTIDLPGRSHSLTELPTLVNDRWGFGETLTANIKEGSPLEAGTHDLDVTVGLRVSYLPVPSVTRVSRSLAVAGADTPQ